MEGSTREEIRQPHRQNLLRTRQQILRVIDEWPTTRAERDKLYGLLRQVDEMLIESRRWQQ